MTSQEVIQYLLQLMNEGKLMDRVTRVLLLWVSLFNNLTITNMFSNDVSKINKLGFTIPSYLVN